MFSFFNRFNRSSQIPIENELDMQPLLSVIVEKEEELHPKLSHWECKQWMIKIKLAKLAEEKKSWRAPSAWMLMMGVSIASYLLTYFLMRFQNSAMENHIYALDRQIDELNEQRQAVGDQIVPIQNKFDADWANQHISVNGTDSTCQEQLPAWYISSVVDRCIDFSVMERYIGAFVECVTLYYDYCKTVSPLGQLWDLLRDQRWALTQERWDEARLYERKEEKFDFWVGLIEVTSLVLAAGSLLALGVKVYQNYRNHRNNPQPPDMCMKDIFNKKDRKALKHFLDKNKLKIDIKNIDDWKVKDFLGEFQQAVKKEKERSQNAARFKVFMEGVYVRDAEGQVKPCDEPACQIPLHQFFQKGRDNFVRIAEFTTGSHLLERRKNKLA